MDNYVLNLLQLCDSTFPTGAFSHSFGLETYIQDGIIFNKETFSKWNKAYIKEQLAYSDGLACRLAYEALENDDMDTVWKLDGMLRAQILARESREGSRIIGERLLTLGNQLYPSLPLTFYVDRISKGVSYGHPAIVFAMIAHSLLIPKNTAVMSYLFSSNANLVQNAVRGIPLGQTQGQLLIKESQDFITDAWNLIETLTEDDFGITASGIEISQMRHEVLNIRIFMS